MKFRALFLSLVASLALMSPMQASYDGFGFNDSLLASYSSGFTYPLTLGAWLNCDATAWADTGFDYVIFLGDDNTDSNTSAGLNKGGAADQVRARRTASGGSFTDADFSFADTTYDDLWVFITHRLTSATVGEICIENSSNCTISGTTSRVLTGLDEVVIGNNWASTGNTLPAGCAVAEPTIWDKVLSDAEVDSLQTGSQTGPEPSSIASGNCTMHHHLAADLSTHVDADCSGPNMTENGSVTFNADHPTITSNAVVPITVTQARRRKQ